MRRCTKNSFEAFITKCALKVSQNHEDIIKVSKICTELKKEGVTAGYLAWYLLEFFEALVLELTN